MKVFVLNDETGAATIVKTNSCGQVQASTWKAALRRVGNPSKENLNVECYPTYTYSADTGKFLHVQFSV